MSQLFNRAFPAGDMSLIPPFETFSYRGSAFSESHLTQELNKYPSVVEYLASSTPLDSLNITTVIQLLESLLIQRASKKLDFPVIKHGLAQLLTYFVLVDSKSIEPNQILPLLYYANAVAAVEYDRRNSLDAEITDCEAIVEMLASALITSSIATNIPIRLDEVVFSSLAHTYRNVLVANRIILEWSATAQPEELSAALSRVLPTISDTSIFHAEVLHASKDPQLQLRLYSSLSGRNVNIINTVAVNLADLIFPASALELLDINHVSERFFKKGSKKYCELFSPDVAPLIKAANENVLTSLSDSIVNCLGAGKVDDLLFALTHVVLLDYASGATTANQKFTNIVAHMYSLVGDDDSTILDQDELSGSLQRLTISLCYNPRFLTHEIMDTAKHVFMSTLNLVTMGLFICLLSNVELEAGMSECGPLTNFEPTLESALLARRSTTFSDLRKPLEKLIDRIISDLKLLLADKKTSSLRNYIEHGEDQRLENIRKVMAAIISLFGLTNLLTIDGLKIDPMTMCNPKFAYFETGLWLIDSCQEAHGLLDFQSYISLIEPEIKKLGVRISQLDNNNVGVEATLKLYETLKLRFEKSLIAFARRTISPQALCSFIATSVSNTEGMSLERGTILAQVVIELFAGNKYHLPTGDWAIILQQALPIMGWSYNLLNQALKHERQDCVTTAKDLLTCLCSVLPDESIFTVLSRFITFAVKDDSFLYLELAVILLDRCGMSKETRLMILKLIGPTLQKTISVIKGGNVSSSRAWLSVLNSILTLAAGPVGEFSTEQLATIDPHIITAVCTGLHETSDTDRLGLAKVRVCTIDAIARIVLRSPQSLWITDLFPCTTWLMKDAVFEFAVGTTSLNSVVRRRSRRGLTTLFTIMNYSAQIDATLQQQFIRTILAGIATTSAVQVMRGFTNVIELLLSHSGMNLAAHERSKLEELLALAKPAVYNMDKKSTHSSVLGTTTTRKSKATIKREYRPRRW